MTESGTWLIAGLGNPGPKYSGNRHNVGAMAVDQLGAQFGGGWRVHKARAEILQTQLPDPATGIRHRLLLAKPRCYMNESGGPVAGLARYFEVPPERIIAVHDELDIDFNQLRLKFGGGEGGHNGLRSLSQSLGTRDYYRVRIGVGRPPGRMDPADYVLRDFGSEQRTDLAITLTEAADAVQQLITAGLAASQNTWHR